MYLLGFFFLIWILSAVVLFAFGMAEQRKWIAVAGLLVIVVPVMLGYALARIT